MKTVTEQHSTIELINKIAKEVSAYYKRKFVWLDVRDMRQEAIVSMLVATQTYDPIKGALPPYLARTARIAVQSWLWAYSSPVKQRIDRNNGRYYGVPEVDLVSSFDVEAAYDLKQADTKAAKILTAYPMASEVMQGSKPKQIAQNTKTDIKYIYAQNAKARRELKEQLQPYFGED